MARKQSASEVVAQLLINFVLPLVILTRFSSQTSLGPTRALLIALAFPVIYEFYNIYKNKKVSAISLIAIGGIIATGGLSLLNLGVGWLAVRRAIPYLFVALVLLGSELIKKPLVLLAVKQIFDMDIVRAAAIKRQTTEVLEKVMRSTAYLSILLFSLISVVSYFVTRLVVTSQINTDAFNQQFARLRLLSFPAITLPLLIGFIGIIWYLIHNLEKLTGLDSEEFLNKPEK